VANVASASQPSHGSFVGLVVAVSLHAVVGIVLARVPLGGLHSQRPVAVEIDVASPKAPDPVPPPRDPPPAEPEPKAIHAVVHKVATRPVPKPMPNQEAKPTPPTDEPPKPVFGVTKDSVVNGESQVAVAVGNTLMTKDRTLAQAPPPPLPAAPPPPAFAPVDEESVAELPEMVSRPDGVYPEMARRLGIEGKVPLKIAIDRKGNVKSVRVLHKVGYGMDEEAVRVMLQSRWRAAKLADGQPVDIAIHFNFRFETTTR